MKTRIATTPIAIYVLGTALLLSLAFNIRFSNQIVKDSDDLGYAHSRLHLLDREDSLCVQKVDMPDLFKSFTVISPEKDQTPPLKPARLSFVVGFSSVSCTVCFQKAVQIVSVMDSILSAARCRVVAVASGGPVSNVFQLMRAGSMNAPLLYDTNGIFFDRLDLAGVNVCVLVLNQHGEVVDGLILDHSSPSLTVHEIRFINRIEAFVRTQPK